MPALRARWSVVLVVLGVAAALAVPAHGRLDGLRTSSGTPAAGQALFNSLGCAGCHATAEGEVSRAGPLLTAAALAARAQEAGKPLGPFIAESIVAPSAVPAPGWVSTVMRPFTELRPAQLDDLVAFLTGAPYSGSGPAGTPVPRNPVAACDAKPSCRSLVSRWAKSRRLPAAAVPGAKVFATAGCLSCHTYGGTGTARVAPDLTRVGARLSRPQLLALVRCAECARSGARMPSFRPLGAANVERVVAFLAASKGRS